MRRVVSLVVPLVVVAACGGVEIPQHNGYRTDTAKPWKAAKALKFDAKLEAKAEGSLSYPDMKRAHWYAVELPSYGSLGFTLDIVPPGDNVNDDFDLAIEILDPGNRMLIRADSQEADAHDLQKKRDLPELVPGRYLIHLYLQSRLDTADFSLHVTFKPTAPASIKSDFPAHVAFLPILPMVPLSDDTPAKYKPPPVVVTHVPGRRPKLTPVVTPPPATTTKARIIGIAVVTGGTQITVGRGMESGAKPGMRGRISGVSGGFTLAACSPRTCTATVSATPDQIKTAGGDVELLP